MEKVSSAFTKHKIDCRWALQVKFFEFFFFFTVIGILLLLIA